MKYHCCGFKDGQDARTMLKNNVEYTQCPVCGVFHMIKSIILREKIKEVKWKN